MLTTRIAMKKRPLQSSRTTLNPPTPTHTLSVCFLASLVSSLRLLATPATPFWSAACPEPSRRACPEPAEGKLSFRFYTRNTSPRIPQPPGTPPRVHNLPLSPKQKRGGPKAAPLLLCFALA